MLAYDLKWPHEFLRSYHLKIFKDDDNWLQRANFQGLFYFYKTLKSVGDLWDQNWSENFGVGKDVVLESCQQLGMQSSALYWTVVVRGML